MTEEKTEETAAEASGKPPVEPASEAPGPAQAPRPEPSGRVGLVLALVALGLSVGLAVAAYFVWHQLQQLSAEQSRFRQQIEDRVEPLGASLQELRLKIERERQQADTQMAKLAEQQASVAHRLSVLAARAGRGEQGWVLSEVEYLLRIANQRLLLQRDVKTARAALNSADARLRELADPRYVSVRRKIAAELEALEAVSDLDRDGLAASLRVLEARVAELPVAGVGYEPPAASRRTPEEQPPAAQGWKSLPAALWASVSELFRLREHDRPVEPMLPPEREYFLRANLRLQLTAARVALLRRDEAQYRAALDTARDWLGAYFAHDSTHVQEVLSRLEDLVELDVAPELPDISGSLRVLREQMELGTARASPESATPGESPPGEGPAP